MCTNCEAQTNNQSSYLDVYAHSTGLLENNNSKIYISVVAIFLTFMCGTFSFGAIWYDLNGFDQYRTLIHRIPTLLSWTCLIGITTIEAVDILIYYFGPFKFGFCLLNIIFKNSVKIFVIILSDFLILARYGFIFHLKNPSAVDDRFWTFLIFVWSAIFSVLFNSVFYILPGVKPINFYICANVDPSPDYKISTTTNIHIEAVSIILHCVLNARITLYKRSNDIGQNPFEKTATYFISNAIGLLIILIYSYLNLKIGMYSLEEINSYPKYILLYIHTLMGPAALGMTILTLYYIKNVSLHQYFSRQLFKS